MKKNHKNKSNLTYFNSKKGYFASNYLKCEKTKN